MGARPQGLSSRMPTSLQHTPGICAKSPGSWEHSSSLDMACLVGGGKVWTTGWEQRVKRPESGGNGYWSQWCVLRRGFPWDKGSETPHPTCKRPPTLLDTEVPLLPKFAETDWVKFIIFHGRNEPHIFCMCMPGSESRESRTYIFFPQVKPKKGKTLNCTALKST